MSHCRLYLWLVLVLSVGSLTARAQLSATLTKLGDSASGSVYQWTVSYNAAYYEAGGGGFGSPAISGAAGAYSENGAFNNGNSFSFDSGNASVGLGNISSQSGTFTIPVGVTGAWVLAVRTTTSNGYSTTTENLGVSQAGSYNPGATKKSFNYEFTNGQSYAVRYVVEEDGVIVVNELVQPGQTVTGSKEIASGATAVDKVFVPAEFSDGGWVEAPLNPTGTGAGATTGSNAYIVLPNAQVTTPHIPSAGPTTPVNTRAITPTTPGIPTAAVIQPAAQPIWKPTTATVDTERLDKATYRQGVDRQLDADKARTKEIVDQLKKMETDATARRAQAKDLADREKAASDASVTANSSMAAQGANAKAAAEALFGNTPSGIGYSLTSGGAPDLSVSLPQAFGGATFNLNPFQGGLGTVASWFRLAVQWLTIATLGAWVWTQLGEWVRGLASVQQAKGNTVAAGTGAQATALAAAGLMTVAIVAALTALLAWSFEGINLPAFVASVTTNPLATVPAGVYWMLDQVFPVAVMVTALVARITFNLYAATIYAGCAAVVRFIVP